MAATAANLNVRCLIIIAIIIIYGIKIAIIGPVFDETIRFLLFLCDICMFKTKRMKLKNVLIIFSTVAITLLQGCHKKGDDTAISPTLDGTMAFDMPLFVLPGEEFTLTPRGASHPKGGGIGYYWFSSWHTVRDTVKTETGPGDGSWTVSVPQSTGTYTITSFAYASEYTSISTFRSFTVVDPSLDGSLKGAGYQSDSVKFVDHRDGGVYYLATAGGNVWMQNNLYYSGAGVSYEDSKAMDPIAGRFYNWNEATKVCPEGWRLPTDADFAALCDDPEGAGMILVGAAGSMMADVYFNGSKMWTFWPDVKITNATKFSAVPMGYGIDQEGNHKFVGTNEYAVFWTSSQEGDTGIYRYIYVDKKDVFPAAGDKDSFLASVRCVKEK